MNNIINKHIVFTMVIEGLTSLETRYFKVIAVNTRLSVCYYVFCLIINSMKSTIDKGLQRLISPSPIASNFTTQYSIHPKTSDLQHFTLEMELCTIQGFFVIRNR